MKTVILMRHAEAAPATGADFERALTPAGHRMARDVAVRLSQRGLWPDIILCSSALRTRQTCENILDIWRTDVTPHVMYDPAIYRADAHHLLSLLQEQDEEHTAIMLIGHNPTIHMASLMLCGSAGAAARPEMTKAFPPSSCAILSFAAESWGGVRKGVGQLADYFYSGEA